MTTITTEFPKYLKLTLNIFNQVIANSELYNKSTSIYRKAVKTHDLIASHFKFSHVEYIEFFNEYLNGDDKSLMRKISFLMRKIKFSRVNIEDEKILSTLKNSIEMYDERINDEFLKEFTDDIQTSVNIHRVLRADLGVSIDEYKTIFYKISNDDAKLISFINQTLNNV